jgi:arylsulfatase A-like enzyme
MASRKISLAATLSIAAIATSTIGCADAPESNTAEVALGALRANSSAARRNVLLVILDDVGAEEIRSYASDLAAAPQAAVPAGTPSVGIVDTNANRVPDGLEDLDGDGYPDGAVATPQIDSLAAAGVRFTQVWANPVCSPTRAGIYTGLYGRHHGLGAPIGLTSMVSGLPTDLATLPEIMDAAGSNYATGFFGKWHLGESDGMLPTDRGWDYFAGSTGGELNYYDWTKTVVSGGNKTESRVTTYASTVNVTDALTWISAQTGSWWATVALNAAHAQATGDAYPPPPSSCLSGRIARSGGGANGVPEYHMTLECADYTIGTLLRGMPSDVLANTTIVFVGDNGDEDTVSQVYKTTHSKNTVYQGGVHVPLIIADGASIAGRDSRGVGRVASPARTVSHMVNTVDIFLTIADIVGVTPASTDSVSLVAYLNSRNAAAARAFSYTDAFWYSAAAVSTLEQANRASGADLSSTQVATLTPTELRGAVRNATYKLVYGSTGYEVYDLSIDPFEQTNLGCTYRATAAGTLSVNVLLAELQRIDSNYPAFTCP